VIIIFVDKNLLLSIKEKKEIIEGVIKRIINIRKIYAPNLLLL